jgi:hypothetical protein
MADLELNNPEFDIVVELNGTSKTVKVQPDETSDGVPFYKCYDGETLLTQVRLDEDGNWEQMWGDLDQENVDAVGKVIAEKE